MATPADMARVDVPDAAEIDLMPTERAGELRKLHGITTLPVPGPHIRQ